MNSVVEPWMIPYIGGLVILAIMVIVIKHEEKKDRECLSE